MVEWKVILAGNHREAERYLREHPEIDRKSCRYAANYSSIIGMRVKTENFIRVGTWYNRKDASEIELCICEGGLGL